MRQADDGTAAPSWLARPQTMHAGFTTTITLEPGSFDAVIYLDRLTPAAVV